MTVAEMKRKSCQLKQTALKMIAKAGSGHPGGSLSAMDIMVILYYEKMRGLDPKNPKKMDRDRFILSKGHACPALYAILADRGYFSEEELYTLRQYGSHLQGQPDKKKTPGIDACAGSLGQGVSTAVGMAMGAKQAGLDCRIYVIAGDGEIQEGQTWEAAMAAVNYKLDNLVWIVDNNGLQIMGANDDVMRLGDIEAKYASFGFEVFSVDGHDYEQLAAAIDAPVSGKPKCIVAHTVKGKGVSFMENQVKWHGGAISSQELEEAIEELEREEKCYE